jgi:hypothetical protein
MIARGQPFRQSCAPLLGDRTLPVRGDQIAAPDACGSEGPLPGLEVDVDQTEAVTEPLSPSNRLSRHPTGPSGRMPVSPSPCGPAHGDALDGDVAAPSALPVAVPMAVRCQPLGDHRTSQFLTRPIGEQPFVEDSPSVTP